MLESLYNEIASLQASNLLKKRIQEVFSLEFYNSFLTQIYNSEKIGRLLYSAKKDSNHAKHNSSVLNTIHINSYIFPDSGMKWKTSFILLKQILNIIFTSCELLYLGKKVYIFRLLDLKMTWEAIRTRKVTGSNYIHFHIYILEINNSMQGWKATTRHEVTTKKSTKRLKHTGNMFRNNLQLKGVHPFRS